jgi:hypothetical protein
MNWSLEQQLANVETRINELQKRRKMLLAKIAVVEQQKKQKSFKGNGPKVYLQYSGKSWANCSGP